MFHSRTLTPLNSPLGGTSNPPSRGAIVNSSTCAMIALLPLTIELSFRGFPVQFVWRLFPVNGEDVLRGCIDANLACITPTVVAFNLHAGHINSVFNLSLLLFDDERFWGWGGGELEQADEFPHPKRSKWQVADRIELLAIANFDLLKVAQINLAPPAIFRCPIASLGARGQLLLAGRRS